MIASWMLRNFKSVREEVVLNFSPLTLFVGQNSAGKSTILQSILLTAQTLQTSTSRKSIILNGRIARLGSFSDIHSNNSEASSIGISFELSKSPYLVDPFPDSGEPSPTAANRFSEQMVSVAAEYSFSGGVGNESRQHFQLQPLLGGGKLAYNSKNGAQNSEIAYVRHGYTRASVLEKLQVETTDVSLNDQSAMEYSIVAPLPGSMDPRGNQSTIQQSLPAGVVLKHFLPVGIAAAYDAVGSDVDTMFELLSDAESIYRHRDLVPRSVSTALATPNFRSVAIAAYTNATERLTIDLRSKAIDAIEELRNEFTLINLARAQASLQTQGKAALLVQLTERSAELRGLLRSGRSARKLISSFPISEPLIFAGNYIVDFFAHKLKYLGPLRDEPKPIYPLIGYSDPDDIGFRGEFTAAVLENNKATSIRYIPSQCFPLNSTTKTSSISSTLAVAVADWLAYLGIASSVSTEDKGKLGHELTIATSEQGPRHDLTHVGVGVSQALPIVVSSLLSEGGSTLIFEQPELHLNPKVQSRLADFFLSLVLAGKQCIVETHSEYIVSRLRYLTVATDNSSICDSTKIFFVEKRGHQSSYRDVKISSRGVIVDWPEGFFDEADRNSADIIRAQIDRAKIRGKKEGSDRK